MARLIIVSNRLPVTIRTLDGGVRVDRSVGGLATGLNGPHEASGGLWIGWPGDLSKLSAAQATEAEKRLEERRCVTVPLSPEDIDRYYEGFSNGVLWPVFHYLIDRIPLDAKYWATYEAVNQRFADAVVARAEPGDRIWVHDYHLCLVPQLVREKLPDAAIGFFLHIPFPSEEVFRLLPWRARILEGLLGADLVGLHTPDYARHFGESLVRVLGLDPRAGTVRVGERRVRFGAFPMGVDAAAIDARAQTPEVERAAMRFRRPTAIEKVIVGIDRLDYTKGIPRRLLAFERLLEIEPSLKGRVKLVQVAVPSREKVPAYRDYRRLVNEFVGRINGAHGTFEVVPVHYLARALGEQDVTALYRAADIVMVTPLRDGMNLVAKEFAAARFDEDGVLILSEFAGASSELAGAVVVNPYDVDATARALRDALLMPRDERRGRMRALRRAVFSHDVHEWARLFLDTLAEVSQAREQQPSATEPPPLDAVPATGPLTLLLDYDGTLVSFTPTPDGASPDPALLDLLTRAAKLPDVDVSIVSGRKREDLEQWLGHLPMTLYAEHALWVRPAGGTWHSLGPRENGWRDQLHPLFERTSEHVPGSLVEVKTAGLAFHWRNASPEMGSRVANELRLQLTSMSVHLPVEVLVGDHVLELRRVGIDKGLAVSDVLRRRPETFIVALGDDRTDEDLFAAMPEGMLAVKVGGHPTRAPWRLPDVPAARSFVERIVQHRSRSL